MNLLMSMGVKIVCTLNGRGIRRDGNGCYLTAETSIAIVKRYCKPGTCQKFCVRGQNFVVK
jgi:hypothetical protein